MGCCVSSHQKPISAAEQNRRSSAVRSEASRRLSEVAAPPEEETVKEVLSETPTPKPPISYKTQCLNRIREEEYHNAEMKKTPLSTAEVSEVSDICSLSESVSTVPDRMEEDSGEVRQRVDRSPAKFRNRNFSTDMRERSTAADAGRSPARRTESSPGRVGFIPGRDRQPAFGRKRDTGETSGRRSRSPATRVPEVGAPRLGLGRSPTARKTGKSPGRVRSQVPEKTGKVEEPEMSKWLPPTTNESLENPLVSLECFIFL